jgi:hypothetical protein
MLAVTTPESLDKAKEVGDILLAMAEAFGDKLESISVTAESVALKSSVQSGIVVKFRLRELGTIWVRSAGEVKQYAVVGGGPASAGVVWFNASQMAASDLGRFGKIAGTIRSVIEKVSQLSTLYDWVSGTLLMKKGLAAENGSDALDFIQGAFTITGTMAPVTASLAFALVYSLPFTHLTHLKWYCASARDEL